MEGWESNTGAAEVGRQRSNLHESDWFCGCSFHGTTLAIVGEYGNHRDEDKKDG